jgi:hypothetical protein
MKERTGISDIVAATVATGMLLSMNPGELLRDEPGGIPINPQAALAAYPNLPEPVAHAQASAVAISRTLETVSFKDEEGGLTMRMPTNERFGSGTVMDIAGIKVILTAAHVVGGQAGQCTNTLIAANGPKRGSARYVGVERQSTAQLPPETQFPAYNNGLDAAVLIPRSPERLEDVPALTPQEDVQVTPGDVLFTINYQPTANRERRSPGFRGDIIGHPVISALVVIGQTDNEIVALTDVKGYGADKDAATRGGSSGSMAVNPKAGYMGEVVGGRNDSNEDELLDWYGVSLPEREDYDIAYIRKLNTVDAVGMLQDANNAAPCAEGALHNVDMLLPGETTQQAFDRYMQGK